MNSTAQHMAAMTATEYTTDPNAYIELRGDVCFMHAIWNFTEFGGALRPVAVFPTDDTFMIGTDDGAGAYYSGCYSRANRFIIIDTAAAVRSATSGMGYTLYRNMAEVMLHEMVHQWCHENGIQDTEADGTHNERFRDAARAHGLVCHMGTMGYNQTHVRKGHWAPFYKMAKLAPTNLARRMRTTHMGADVEAIVNAD